MFFFVFAVKRVTAIEANDLERREPLGCTLSAGFTTWWFGVVVWLLLVATAAIANALAYSASSSVTKKSFIKLTPDGVSVRTLPPEHHQVDERAEAKNGANTWGQCYKTFLSVFYEFSCKAGAC